MPAKMHMFILNGQQNVNQIRTFNANNANISTAPKPSGVLNAPMITRIHGTPSGCGSCGRH